MTLLPAIGGSTDARGHHPKGKHVIACAAETVCNGTNRADTIRAAGGNLVNALGGNDTVTIRDGCCPAPGGFTEVHAGTGDDMIRALAGENILYCDDGNDVIEAANGSGDFIDCGNGQRDRVVFDDGLDTVENCEVQQPS